MRRLAEEVAGHRPDAADRRAVDQLVACPLPLVPILADGELLATTDEPGALLEVLTRRYYKIRDLDEVTVGDDGVLRTSYERNDRTVHVFAVRAGNGGLAASLAALARAAAAVEAPDTAVTDVFMPLEEPGDEDADALAARIAGALASASLPGSVRRVAVVASAPDGTSEVLTFRRPGDEGVRPYWMSGDGASADSATFEEDVKFRGLHPMIARRMQMWRLENFEIRRLPAAGEVHLFDCVGRDNPSDERLVAVAEVRDLTPVRDEHGRAVALPEVEGLLVACCDAIRDARTRRPSLQRLEWNRITLFVWPPVVIPLDEVEAIARRLVPLTDGLGLEQIVVSARLVLPGETEPVETVMRLGYEAGRGMTVRLTPPPTAPMQPLDEYTRKRMQTRRRGLVYPYDLVPMLQRAGGEFVEHDLDEDGRLAAVDRPPGSNRAGVVIGVVRTPTALYPEGMARVAILGDATKAMGSITEAECRPHPRGDRSRRRDGRPDRVARPVRRGADRHGLRQREPRLGRRGSCAGSSSTPSGVVRSTSSSPASTSAPSRTGTPRRRC